MKIKRISDTISNLNESIVEEATAYQKASAKRNAWMKWVAVAACFALVLAIGIPALYNMQIGQDKTLVDNIWIIRYDNAYYEIIEDNPEALEKFGVVTEVTEDVIGEHICYLQFEYPESERSQCIVSDEKTEMELLEYKPANNKAHRIFRNGEKYYIARFCNYLNPDDVSYSVSTALEVFGIYGSDDIKSIAPTSTDNTWKITGTAVTDKDTIAAFYNEIIRLQHYSWDEYHDLAFADHLKEAEAEGSTDAEIYQQYADDLCVLVIETVDGIRFTIDYYPSFEWIYFSVTQTHCQITTAMSDWIKDHMQ